MQDSHSESESQSHRCYLQKINEVPLSNHFAQRTIIIITRDSTEDEGCSYAKEGFLTSDESATVMTHYNSEVPLPFPEEDIDPGPVKTGNGIPSPAQIISQDRTPPPSSIIIPDPYKTYLNSLGPGITLDVLTVAKELHALQSLMMLVNNQTHVESIIDPGSQIIAMSDTICHDLGLHYDPQIQLNMQSVNGTVDKSLGLARNTPCCIGDITLYLQIHVIHDPAYNILMGRPFNILTKRIVCNYANEDQTITIRDPNLGEVTTIPTLPRGSHKHQLKPDKETQNFHIASRN